MQGEQVFLKVEFTFNNVDESFNVSNNIDKANFFYSYDGSNWTKIGDTLGMTYDLKLFTGYRSAIYSYPTISTGGYADIDRFDYSRAEWNVPTVIEPDENGYYFHSTFEGEADGWSSRGAAKTELTNDTSFEGSASLHITDRTAAWNGTAKPLNSAFKAGETYSFSANVYYDEGGMTDTFYMKLQYKGSDGETYYDSIAEATAVKGEWVQLANQEYTIPDGATNLVVYLETAESKNSFYADDIIGAVAHTEIAGAGVGNARPVTCGDINNDGEMDVFDLALAKRGIVSGFADIFTEMSADVDKSRKVTVSDIILLQKYILGEIRAFPHDDGSIPISDSPAVME